MMLSWTERNYDVEKARAQELDARAGPEQVEVYLRQVETIEVLANQMIRGGEITQKRRKFDVLVWPEGQRWELEDLLQFLSWNGAFYDVRVVERAEDPQESYRLRLGVTPFRISVVKRGQQMCQSRRRRGLPRG